MKRKKIPVQEERVKYIDSDCIAMYDDIFGTTRGAGNLEPCGHIVYNPTTKKDYFCYQWKRYIL